MWIIPGGAPNEHGLELASLAGRDAGPPPELLIPDFLEGEEGFVAPTRIDGAEPPQLPHAADSSVAELVCKVTRNGRVADCGSAVDGGSPSGTTLGRAVRMLEQWRFTVPRECRWVGNHWTLKGPTEVEEVFSLRVEGGKPLVIGFHPHTLVHDCGHVARERRAVSGNAGHRRTPRDAPALPCKVGPGFHDHEVPPYIAPQNLDGGPIHPPPVAGPPGIAIVRCRLPADGRFYQCRVVKPVAGVSEALLDGISEMRVVPYWRCEQVPDGGWVPVEPVSMPYTLIVHVGRQGRDAGP